MGLTKRRQGPWKSFSEVNALLVSILVEIEMLLYIYYCIEENRRLSSHGPSHSRSPWTFSCKVGTELETPVDRVEIPALQLPELILCHFRTI